MPAKAITTDEILQRLTTIELLHYHDRVVDVHDNDRFQASKELNLLTHKRKVLNHLEWAPRLQTIILSRKSPEEN